MWRYNYAGLTGGRFCFCSQNAPLPSMLFTTSDCGQQCSGNPSQVCGGNGYLSVHTSLMPLQGLGLTVDQDFLKAGETVEFTASLQVHQYFLNGCLKLNFAQDVSFVSQNLIWKKYSPPCLLQTSSADTVYSMDFGDGSVSSSDGSGTWQHVYTTSGRFTATVSARNADDAQDDVCRNFFCWLKEIVGLGVGHCDGSKRPTTNDHSFALHTVSFVGGICVF